MRRMSCMGANCKQKSRNHPKPAAFFISSRLFSFAPQKKVMFNMNKDNHIVTAQHHTDMRMGVNGMCGRVRQVGL